MIKNDYLTAKLQELSEVIKKVLKLIEDARLNESHQAISEALKRLVGLNSEIAETLSYKDLVSFIGAYEAADSIKFMILAELLKLSGDVYKKEQDSNRSFTLYLKAFNIYVKALLLDKDTCLDQCRNNMKDIISDIGEFELPYDTHYSVFQYFELTGRFDRAEDTLYDLLEASETNSDMVAEGINFYKRLLDKSEAELEQGNLPLEEVEDGLQRLQRLYNA